MWGSIKDKKIKQNEKKLAKLHGSITLVCSNDECRNKTKVTEEDASRVFQCSKCFKGILKRTKDKYK